MKSYSDRNFFFMAACAAALLLALAPLAMSAANLDEKARYERVLEEKVDGLLSGMLGPGKARVMVQATVDFSTKENIVSGAELAAAGPAPEAAAGENAPWWAGIMENVRQNAAAIPENTTVKKETIYPQAMVKKLSVTLALSDTLSPQEAERVRAVVSGMLELDAGRGDRITVVRAGFAPVWNTPEMLGLVVRYGVIAAVLIIAMGILGFGFIKMASAMSSMAGAGQQKISMEMSGFGGAPAEAGGLAEFPAAAAPRRAAAEEGGAAGTAGPVVFNVPADKLSTLVGMLAKDSPEDISLIAVHLPPAQRKKFISMFPAALAADIVASVAKVRFVEPDMITKIKEELERRLSGSVGGYEKALEFLDSMTQKEKRALYESMLRTHPETAAQVRRTLIFPEDIEKLSEKDFGLLAGSVSVAQWGNAAWALPEGVKAKLQAHLTKRGWQMVEQALKFDRPPEVEIEKAVEAVTSAMWNLVSAGRLPSYAGGQPELVFAPPQEPPAAPPPPPPPAEMSGRLQVPAGRDIT